MTDIKTKELHSYRNTRPNAKPKECYESKFLGQYGLINYTDPDITWVVSRGYTNAKGKMLCLHYKALRLG
jgi:hypothetical protein